MKRILQAVFVELSPAERAEAIAIGIARQQNHVASDTDALRLFDDPNHEHALGAIGEFALAKWHPVFALDTRLLRGGDGGRDFVIDGKRINLKTFAKLGRLMLVRTDKVDSADLYIMATFQEQDPYVMLRGFCDTAMVKTQEKRRARNPKLPYINYEVQPGVLRPMAELVDVLNLTREAACHVA